MLVKQQRYFDVLYRPLMVILGMVFIDYRHYSQLWQVSSQLLQYFNLTDTRGRLEIEAWNSVRPRLGGLPVRLGITGHHWGAVGLKRRLWSQNPNESWSSNPNNPKPEKRWQYNGLIKTHSMAIISIFCSCKPYCWSKLSASPQIFPSQ